MATDDITHGELSRRLDRLDETVKAETQRRETGDLALNSEIDRLRSDAEKVWLCPSHHSRLEALEGWRDWTLRIIVAVVLGAVLATVIVTQGASP